MTFRTVKLTLETGVSMISQNFMGLFLHFRRALVVEISIYVLFLVVVVALQWAGGAFKSEFGGNPDEASHYVTGLMMRDFLATPHHWTDPMKFAEEYYIHYPKVGIGHWPPLFYVLQAVWTRLFSPSRVSMLLLMSLVTTLLAITVYRVTRSEFGPLVGVGMGLLLIALPLIQKSNGMLMMDILMALLVFWGTLCFGRYLDSGRWRDAIFFSIFASLAILTKGTGLVLALVPPIALLLSRRFELLARLSFWFPAVFVLGVCGPWYWLTREMIGNGIEKSGLHFMLVATRYYSWQLLTMGGLAFSVVAAIGLFVKVIKPLIATGVDGKWATTGALLLSVLLMAIMVPIGLIPRYLISAVAPLLVFLAAGIIWLADRLPLPRLTKKRKVVISLLAILLIFVGKTFSIPKKAYYGFAEIAQNLLSIPDFDKSVVLVSSDSRGEGMFISEIAMRERRPSHVILRASKVMSSSRLDGSQYTIHKQYGTPKKIMNALQSVPIGLVVIDTSKPVMTKQNLEHHRLLVKAIESSPQKWELLNTYSLTRQETTYPGALRVYRFMGNGNKRGGKIRLKIIGLDKDLEFTVK